MALTMEMVDVDDGADIEICCQDCQYGMEVGDGQLDIYVCMCPCENYHRVFGGGFSCDDAR